MSSLQQDPTSVLVVEDEALIAFDIETLLESDGYDVIGPFETIATAAKAAAGAHSRAAILDVNIKNELVWPIADILQERGVPFLFLTGYESSVRFPQRFANVIRMEKPFNKDQLMGAVTQLIKYDKSSPHLAANSRT